MFAVKTGEDTDLWGRDPLRDHTAKTTACSEFSFIKKKHRSLR